MRVVYDTNALYALTGVCESNLQQVDVLDVVRSNNNFIPVSVWAEAVVRNSDSLDAVKKLSATTSNIGTLVPVGYEVGKSDYFNAVLYEISAASCLQQIQQVLDAVKNEKDELEAKYTRFFHYYVSVAMLIDSARPFEGDDDLERRFSDMATPFLRGSVEPMLDYYSERFKAAYASASPLKQLKGDFEDFLDIYRTIAASINSAARLGINLWACSDTELEIVKENAHVPSERRISKKTADEAKNGVRDRLWDGELQDKPLAAEYLLTIAERLLLKEARIEPKDITDFIVIASMEHVGTDAIILTGDGRMKKFLSHHGRLNTIPAAV